MAFRVSGCTSCPASKQTQNILFICLNNFVQDARTKFYCQIVRELSVIRTPIILDCCSSIGRLLLIVRCSRCFILSDSPVVSDSSFPDKWPSSAPQLRWPIDRHSAGDRLLSGHSSTTAAGHYLAGQSASEHSITGRSIGSNSAGSEDLLTGRSGEWIECRPLGVDRRPVNNPASDVTTVRIKSCDTNSNTMVSVLPLSVALVSRDAA